MKINSDFASVHSYLCADGYVVRNLPTQKAKYYRLGLRNTNEALLLDFQNKFEKVFNIRPPIRKSKDRCEIGSKEIYTKLIKLFGSFRSREWQMLPNLDGLCAAAWICTFFDCEGWVQARKAKSRSISAESVNCKGLLQIQKELKEKFNIKSNIRQRKNRATYTLDIFGKENIIKFKENIGFLHKAKRDKLDEAINSYADYCWSFPEDRDLKYYIKTLMQSKATVKKPKTIRISSIIKENLIQLSNHLTKLGISSKVYGPWVNSSGSKYYELYIYDKASREKLIKKGLLSDKQIKKLK